MLGSSQQAARSRAFAARRSNLDAERGLWARRVHAAVTVFLFLLCLRLWTAQGSGLSGGAGVDGAPVTFEDGDTTVEGAVSVEGESLESAEVLSVRIKRKDKELEITRRELRHSLKKVKDLERKLEKAQTSGSDSGSERRSGGSSDTSDKVRKLEKRDKALIGALSKATKSVSLLSRHILKTKFGGTDSEPYRARMTVNFPSSMPGAPTGDIVIEFAPSDLMPTAVLFFMTQIEAGVWNGMSFIRNAGHVLQASSQTPTKQYMGKIFKLPYQDSSIPFQEYSEKYPHEKYTLGLAGRPGGPDFYISTQDNTRNHGPGGQGSYDLPAEADSCFAKVVDGFDVVDRLHTAKKNHDSFEGMVEFVEIKEFSLLL